jgi:hypothetical protein
MHRRVDMGRLRACFDWSGEPDIGTRTVFGIFIRKMGGAARLLSFNKSIIIFVLCSSFRPYTSWPFLQSA